MRIIKWKYNIKRKKIKLGKRKTSTKCVLFFRVGVERVRKKEEIRKCSLTCKIKKRGQNSVNIANYKNILQFHIMV